MKAFISYTRSKDQQGAVDKLRRLFGNEMSLYEPSAQVFQDKNAISVGDVFPEVLAKELNQSDLLVILISPAWLASGWCRWEYELFTKKEHDLRINPPRLFPMLWVETPQLETPQGDPIAKALKTCIHKDFRDFRTLAINDPRYEGEVAAMAERAIKISKRGPSAAI